MLLVLSLLLLLPVEGTVANDTVPCMDNYDGVVNAATESKSNQFEIQRVFFPPDKRSPVFVVVVYYYCDSPADECWEFKDTVCPTNCSDEIYDNCTMISTSEDCEVWYWATSSFYFLQSLHVFQFTSLFFSDLELFSANVMLTVPTAWRNASPSHKQLLTQRVGYCSK